VLMRNSLAGTLQLTQDQVWHVCHVWQGLVVTDTFVHHGGRLSVVASRCV
jgi:hypothetical protein